MEGFVIPELPSLSLKPLNRSKDAPIEEADVPGKWLKLEEYQRLRRAAVKRWKEADRSMLRAFRVYGQKYRAGKSAVLDQYGKTKSVYNKQLLLYYVVIMVHTGMRPIEARELTWKNVKRYHFQDGSEGLEIWVFGKRKWRPIVVRPNVANWITRLAYMTTRKTFDEVRSDPALLQRPIFGGVKSFKKGLAALFKAAGLDAGLSAYSFRHTFINYQILYRAKRLDEVAVLSGNSVKVIEEYYYALTPFIHAEREGGHDGQGTMFD
jgi:integrase